jgi:hypothetical protein
MRDFTLASYLQLIDAIRSDKQLDFFGVRDWILQRPLRGCVVRHDVDRSPMNALRMAQAEAEQGLRTTYYFRVVGSAYNTKVMRAIHALGHEVGYHYEDLALAHGSQDKALQLFAKHLAMIRDVAPVTTVAMHGSPLSRFNNVDMWDHASFAQFDLLGDAFLSIDYAGAYYFTDTGRAWDAGANNLRDRPPGSFSTRLQASGTPGLIDFVRNHPIDRIAISAHPERWNSRMSGWYFQWVRDSASNLAKRALQLLR